VAGRTVNRIGGVGSDRIVPLPARQDRGDNITGDRPQHRRSAALPRTASSARSI
jgi:hypothetical protein